MEQPSFRNEPSIPELSNPPVKDGINTPDRRPLRDVVINLTLMLAALALFFVALDGAARLFAPFIPFRWERSLVGGNLLETSLDEEGSAKQRALRDIASRLAAAMDLPDDMELSVWYNPGTTVNAFATFGGNILIFQGLLDAVGSEDELAMVLAHEIAHVKHRDVIKGVVRAGGLFLLSIGLQDSGTLMRAASSLGMAGYSRSQESEADREAVAALGQIYGHAGGATEFFKTLLPEEERPVSRRVSRVATLTSSHPDTAARLEASRREAEVRGIAASGALTPLPAVLAGENP